MCVCVCVCVHAHAHVHLCICALTFVFIEYYLIALFCQILSFYGFDFVSLGNEWAFVYNVERCVQTTECVDCYCLSV